MSIVIPSKNELKALTRAVKEGVEVGKDIAQILGVRPKAFFGTVKFNGLTIKGVIDMAELREGQHFSATVSLTTRAGNPAAYQKGSESWTSSDPTVASVTPSADDPLTADVVGLNGAANTPVLVTFKCDGDPDDNESRDVIATLDVVVTQGEAFVATIAAGTPTDVTPAP